MEKVNVPVLHYPTQRKRLKQFAVSHFVISVLGSLLAMAVGFLLLVLASQSERAMYIVLIVCSVAGMVAYAAAGFYSAETYCWNGPKSGKDRFLAFLFPSLIAWGWGSVMLYCASCTGLDAYELVSILILANLFLAFPSLVMVVTSLVLGFLDGGLLRMIICMLFVGGLPPLLFLLGSIWGGKKNERRAMQSIAEKEKFDGTQQRDTTA